MLISVPSHLLSDQGLPPAAKVLLIAISALATPVATYEELAELTGMPQRTIHRMIKLLEGTPSSKYPKPKKLLKTKRVKRDGLTATFFKVVETLPKRQLLRGDDDCQLGSLVDRDMPEWQFQDMSENMPKRQVGVSQTLPKRQFRENKTPLIKEISKDISYELTNYSAPLEDICKVYESVRIRFNCPWDQNTDIGSFKDEHRSNIERVWVKTCNRDINQMERYFETCAQIEHFMKRSPNPWQSLPAFCISWNENKIAPRMNHRSTNQGGDFGKQLTELAIETGAI
jgi:predicted DNA-binding transcriptional regulator AlpA